MKRLKRILSMCTAFIISIVTISISHSNYLYAAGSVPQHTNVFYVNDYAGVLSVDTINYIINMNDKLFSVTGAQFVVTTTKSTGGKPISDYALEMFNEWGIGAADKNNGVLLVLDIVNQDYYLSIGEGLELIFDYEELRNILDEFLEPDFVIGNYDKGVKNTFHAILGVLDKIYGTSFASYNDGINSIAFESGGDNSGVEMNTITETLREIKKAVHLAKSK